jgi:hypothetical protein
MADPGRLLPRFVAFLDSQGLSTVTVARDGVGDDADD